MKKTNWQSEIYTTTQVSYQYIRIGVACVKIEFGGKSNVSKRKSHKRPIVQKID